MSDDSGINNFTPGVPTEICVEPTNTCFACGSGPATFQRLTAELDSLQEQCNSESSVAEELAWKVVQLQEQIATIGRLAIVEVEEYVAVSHSERGIRLSKLFGADGKFITGRQDQPRGGTPGR